MANAIKPLDVVALTVDLPECNLRRGQVGTVVDILAEGNAFEVEFSDREGRTFESLGLRAEQIMALRHEPVNKTKARTRIKQICTDFFFIRLYSSNPRHPRSKTNISKSNPIP